MRLAYLFGLRSVRSSHLARSLSRMRTWRPSRVNGSLPSRITREMVWYEAPLSLPASAIV